jgi:RNA polymerase sigma factor (sigma-70 family)
MTRATPERATDLMKVAPAQQGARTDLEDTSPPSEGMSHATEERLRAIAERAPEPQRGMVAAKMAKLPQGRHASIDASSQADAAEKLPRGVNQHSSLELPSQAQAVAATMANLRVGHPTASIDAISQADAAEKLNVSRPTVQRARKVLESACEPLIKAVDDGLVSVNEGAQRGMAAARMANLSNGQRAESIDSGTSMSVAAEKLPRGVNQHSSLELPSQAQAAAARMANLRKGRPKTSSIDPVTQADAAELEAEAKARRPKHSGKVGNGDVTHSAIPKKQLVEEGRRARAEVLTAYLTLRDAQPRDEGAVREAAGRVLALNEPLVAHVADRYVSGRTHLQRADLEQEGRMGLLRSLEDYDPARAGFSTWAIRWIKNYITKAVFNEPEIRLPFADDVARLRRARGPIEAKSGRAATAEELGAVVKMSPARVATIRKAAAVTQTIAMDAPTTDESDVSLHDLIASSDELPDEAADRGRRARTVRELVARLPPREREVISRRMSEETLTMVGDSLGVCRERARQVEQGALQTLRGEVRARGLEGIR